MTFFPVEIINVCTKGHDNPTNICQDVPAKCQAGSQMSLENVMEIYPTAFRTFHFISDGQLDNPKSQAKF